MPDEFELRGEWSGSPGRLKNDKWGAWINYTKAPPKVGDKVEIVSRGGRRFREFVHEILWTGVRDGDPLALCRTDRKLPPAQQAAENRAALDYVRPLSDDSKPASSDPKPPGIEQQAWPATSGPRGEYATDAVDAGIDELTDDDDLTLDDIPF